MVDRLEELLAMMDDEDDGEEKSEDEAGTAMAAVPAARVPGIEAQEDPEEDRGTARPGPVWGEADLAPADGGAPEQTAGPCPTPPGEQIGVPGTPGPVSGGTQEEDGIRLTAAPWWDAAVVPVMRPDGRAVLRTPGARDVEVPELSVPGRAPEAETAQIQAHRETADGQGLETLYRQTVRAGLPPVQALPVEQAGRTFRAEEPGRTAALTVDELDRAVRRDSRRYDGGMTLF